MKGRVTLILLGVLLALSAYVYFVEHKGKEKKERAEQLALKVIPWEKDAITGLHLHRRGEHFSFEAEGDNWRITAPLRLDADKSALDGFISAISSSSIEREITAEDPSGFGLAEPVYTLILQKSGTETDTLFIGDKNPTGKFLFVRRPGEEVILLTGTGLETHLKKNLFDFRDKQALAFQKADVRDLKIQSPRGSLLIERRGTEWFIVEPIEAFADKNTVEALLNKLSSARAQSFESETADHAEIFGLSRPGTVLTLSLGEERSQKQLSLGSAKESDRYYARDSGRPAVFTVDSTTYYGLQKSLFDLRDKHIARFDREQVKQIEIRSAGNDRFSCHLDSARNWQIVSPDSLSAKNWKISSFLSSLETLSATAFIGENIKDRAVFGFRTPKVEVFLMTADADTVLHLVLGAGTGEDIYVANRTTGWTYQADKGIIDSLTPEITEWAEENIDVENEENE